MLLIINSEDLGTNAQINDETFGLIDAGLVTSCNIIANSPVFDQAAAGARHFPHCSFAVHLNLTAFRPLTQSDALKPILDGTGLFSGWEDLRTVRMTFALGAALFKELSAQVYRVLEAGVPVSHFDSHQHIHTIPKLFPILKALQRRFGIQCMRSTINLLSPGVQMTVSRGLRKGLFRTAMRHVYRTTSPDGLGEFRDFYAWLAAQQMPAFQNLELMVHPGAPEEPYVHEIKLLKSDWQGLLPRAAILGSYHSLQAR